MTDIPDITVTIRIESSADVPAGALIAALSALSRSIFIAESEEIDAMQAEFRELPTAVFDAMRYRLDRIGEGRALNIDTTKPGSLVVLGAAAGLAYWLADKTLGETVKEAWKDSETHERLKAFLKARVFKKRDRIAQRFPAQRFRLREEAQTIEVSTPSNTPSIEITVVPDPTRPVVPRPSQQGDQDRSSEA